jgi:ABC-type transport system involved in multi-copper enzyme maturation permease subunit
MNHAEKSFNNAFKSWKIWISVFLALSFALFMLFRSLNENHYVFVENGSGTHSWRDSNGNKKVDLKIKMNFF